MFGRGYVIDHCVSTFLRYRREQAYKSYVTNALKAITENTSRYATYNGMVECGSRMSMTYDEIIGNTVPQDDNRTAAEVIDNIKAKLERMGDEP